MRPPFRHPAGPVVLAAGGICLVSAALGFSATSSHREAPFVTENPKVDGTDLYMFNSYEPGREDFVTIVANYLPLQDPYGGPNYFAMDPDARYEIHIDNDGDAEADLTFRFQFQQELRDIALEVGDPGNTKKISVPLANLAPITPGSAPGQNVIERFTARVVVGDRDELPGQPIIDARTGGDVFEKPIDNIGTKSIPDYAAYADGFVYDVALPNGPRGRLFVGQRKDPFVVNLGETFDLVNNNPLGPVDAKEDSLADKNVTSLILEVPKTYLLSPGQTVVGAWTSAKLRQVRALKTDPTFSDPSFERGAWIQVSRLGNPLVNEVVIGLKDKDRFNASKPVNDTQFADYITNPTLPEIIQALFGVQAPDLFPRADLVQIFATGVPGLNANGGFGEMLRLNTAIPAVPPGQQSNLGVLGGDLAGFPNGRRPGDDVVDIALRAVMGVLLDPSVAPDGQLPYTDGAVVDASFFESGFPYLRDPIPGAPQ